MTLLGSVQATSLLVVMTLMLYQTERLEQTELLENKNGDFALKALRNSVISAFDKEIQNKTHQKEKNRSRLASVM